MLREGTHCNRRPLFSLCLALGVAVAGAGAAAAGQTAVVATVQADYSGAAHSVVAVEPLGGPRTVSNNLLPTGTSDITVAAYGDSFYRLERFMRDNVAKFDIAAPDTPIWQYSTQDAGATTSSNPKDLVFLDEQTAYVLRFGATTAWRVDLATTTEGGFKTGEIDLSPYADADGLPEMVAGVVVGNRLFVVLQRLDRDNSWEPQTAYVAVFDTGTNQEIETSADSTDSVLGIPLPIKNPGAIQYQADTDTLYIQAAGKYTSWSGTPAEYSGGIVSLDPGSYQTAMILDDGDDADHPYGNISGMAIVSANKGYFVGYAGWGDNTLYSLDLTTGTTAAIAGLANKNIAGMEAGAYADENGMLWVCNATDHRIEILDTATDTVDEQIDTNLDPVRVVFAGQAAEVIPNGSGNDSGLCFVALMTGTVSSAPWWLIGLGGSSLLLGSAVRRRRSC